MNQSIQTTLTALAAMIFGSATASAVITHLDGLNGLSGVQSITAGGNTFDGYVRNDGGTGWLLIGRGRENWEFDTDGQGGAGAAASSVLNGADLGTVAAFAPAMYTDAVINELIANSAGGVDLTDVEIRLRRATDQAGTNPYQEVRWNPTIQTTWRGDVDFGGASGGYQVIQDITSGIGSPSGPVIALTGDTWNTSGGGASPLNNGEQRVFTWATTTVRDGATARPGLRQQTMAQASSGMTQWED